MKTRIPPRDLILGLLFTLLCLSVSLRAHGQTKVISAGGTSGGGGGSGTVESVAASVPAYMTLSGSPITTSGTLALGFAAQAQGTVFAGPCSGAGAVTFRLLCAADIPSLAPSKITGTAVIDSDARLTNARTPTAHASTHAAAGSDAVTLTQAQITGLVSDLAGKQATGNYVTALTGDVVATGPGSVSATIQSDSVALGPDTTGGYAGSSTEGGAATTATALTANPTNCSAGSYALGVDASGNSEGCTADAGITALTGDVTASGSGSVAATLATVNSNVGSFTNASITVDAKGRITAASSGSSSAPGGADTQVQYNDGGAFGGDAQLTFNETSGLTTVTASSNDGSAAFRVLPGSGSSSTVINNNGSMVINGDGGTAANPLDVQSGGSSRFRVAASGTVLISGANASIGIGSNTSINTSGRIETKGLGLVQTSVKTSAYTTGAADSIVRLDPTSGGFTLTLSSANAAAASISGAHQILWLKNVSASTNTITITPTSGTIDGAASLTITTAHGSMRVFFDGTNWWSM